VEAGGWIDVLELAAGRFLPESSSDEELCRQEIGVFDGSGHVKDTFR
jgi:hypothetical protein